MNLNNEGTDDGSHEATTLLSRRQHSELQDEHLTDSRTSRTWPWINVVVLCIAIAITSDIGDYLLLAPRLRLYESIVCTRYYLLVDPSLIGNHGFVLEEYCKVDAVQENVAMIFGWQVFFDSVPAILLPVPYGFLADKYGRKWITVLALTGCTMSFIWTLFMIGVLHLPLQYVWLSSLFFLIGGGPLAATTMISTIVADVVPPEKRSRVFLYRFASDLVAECLIPPVTSIIMTKSVWIPLIAAVGFQWIGVAMAFALPETLLVIASDKSRSLTSDTLAGAESLQDEVEHELIQRSDQKSVANLWSLFQQIKQSFYFLFCDAAVAALLSTFFISKVGRQSINLLLQYVSKRYQWTLSKAGLLFSLRAGVNIVLYLIILPAIMSFTSTKSTSASKDLWIAKGSIALMILGTLSLSLSATPALMIVGLIIYTLGTGFAPIVRSLITSLVGSYNAGTTNDIGRLYALIAVMEGIGSLVAGPSMAFAFRLGISLGRSWLGLPFGVATFLFVQIAWVMLTVKV